MTVSVSSRLVPIMQRSFSNNIRFIGALPLGDEEFDVQVPVLTAVGHLGKALKVFVLQFSIHQGGPIKSQNIRGELEKHANGKKIVGLSWFSSATVGRDAALAL